MYPGWLAVDQAAVAITETAPLLLTPGRRCQNGKPVPVDRADWKQYVAALADVGRLAHRASQARNFDALRRHQRQAERRVCELPQGLSRQGRHRGEWSNPMSVNSACVGSRRKFRSWLGGYNHAPDATHFGGARRVSSSPSFAQEWIEFANQRRSLHLQFPESTEGHGDDLTEPEPMAPTCQCAS